MDQFAGLNVSVNETSVCIVDETGKIVREVKVASEPDALLTVVKNRAYHFKRIGLEAGPLSQWLYSALAEAELPVVCVETRHMHGAEGTDQQDRPQRCARHCADDAGGALPSGSCEDATQSETADVADPSQAYAVEGHSYRERSAPGTLRNFGLKVVMVGTVKFEARIKELIENLPDLAVLVEPLLVVRRVLREQISILHRRLLVIVRDDAVCRRLRRHGLRAPCQLQVHGLQRGQAAPVSQATMDEAKMFLAGDPLRRQIGP